MQITDIKDYKKGKYEVYLNDEFAFILYKSELKQFGVEKGKELSADVVDTIVAEVLTKRAKKRAMNLLLKNDMPEKKLRDKLLENRYPSVCIDEAIAYVKSYHYIDDNRYARSYIASKAYSSSKSVIRNKLLEKGISKSVIEWEMISYYENDPLNENVEEKLISQLLIKKCKGDYNLDYVSRQKLFASLYRKGFSLDKIEREYEKLSS